MRIVIKNLKEYAERNRWLLFSEDKDGCGWILPDGHYVLAENDADGNLTKFVDIGGDAVDIKDYL